uniref:Protein kinase domain-containing protein n=1 Tax=Globisporangium ultimum (strain ATCC 200006 / CBS 805.95 / DAOM BR144) TaxID=431595 RepID=K3X7S4_GLOUD
MCIKLFTPARSDIYWCCSSTVASTTDAEADGNTKYTKTLSPLVTVNNSPSANRTGSLSTGCSNLDSKRFLANVPAGDLWGGKVITAARIPRENVSEEFLVSRGGYGEVYIGNFNDKRVAIKALLPEKRKNLKQINAFLAVAKLMVSLDHPQIAQFIGVAWDSLMDLCVVLEFMGGGDLRALLTQFEEVEPSLHGFDHDKVKMTTSRTRSRTCTR